MCAIDIGQEAADYGATSDQNWTHIGTFNPANDTGIITQIEVWFWSNATGFKVGTFFNTGGNDYKCRDAHTIGGVASGSKQTFSGITDFNVATGDVIGEFHTGGGLETKTDAAGDIRKISGVDHVIVDDEATYNSVDASRDLALKGTGTREAVGLEEKSAGMGAKMIAGKLI